MALSATVILIGLVSLGVRGLNFGIEFVGGTAWQVQTPAVSVAQARNAIRPFGLGSATIETLGSGDHRTLQVQDKLRGVASGPPAAVKSEVSAALARVAHVPASAVSISDVGPTWGGAITNRALEALAVFFVAIGAYIAFRFEWKMAAAALIAVLHDLIVTVGIYALSGFQVTPSTVVAVLTILGYSLYDTIVVFDRVLENSRDLAIHGRMTYSDTVNLSMNQVLMRSINTSVVAILPILSVLVIGAQLLGATTLQNFGLALFIGLTTGAYSSIFIASPLLAVLKEREPRYRLLKQKLESKGRGGVLLSPAAAAAARSRGATPSRQRVADGPNRQSPSDDGQEDMVEAGVGARPARQVEGQRPSGHRPPATSKRAAPRSKGRRRS